ncbi:hypothetical protein C0992_011017 [Termitomyces sp. T32_za158]|nr:hypothetical protein C0992_011017 [Termitomyces sp. T32_za158]
MAKAKDNLFNLKMHPKEQFMTFIIRFEKEAYKTGWNYNVLRWCLSNPHTTVTRLWSRRLTNPTEKTTANTTTPELSGILGNCGKQGPPGLNNQTPEPQPPAQLNASDTLKAPEPSSDKSTDPNALLNDPTPPKDEEALQANRFRSTNKPWIDIPLDIQERQ